METNYNEKLKKLIENAEKYKQLPLEEFIRRTLIESGFSDNLMNNVYIDEIVNYPEIFGCYKDGEKIISYYTNSKGEKISEEYEDYTKFMLVFLRTANISMKYPTTTKKK